MTTARILKQSATDGNLSILSSESWIKDMKVRYCTPHGRSQTRIAVQLHRRNTNAEPNASPFAFVHPAAHSLRHHGGGYLPDTLFERPSGFGARSEEHTSELQS